MKQIEDPKLVFYLKHQSLIDEWINLAALVPAAAHSFLSSCAEDVEALAVEKKAGSLARAFTEDGEYPKLFLVAPGWADEGASTPDHVRIAIGVEWHRTKQLGFAGPPPNCPYAGVWVNVQRHGGQALSRAVREKAREQIAAHRLKSHAWWPAYRYEPAQGEYWKDLGAYRRQLVRSADFFWTTFAGLVDQVVQSGKSG